MNVRLYYLRNVIDDKTLNLIQNLFSGISEGCFALFEKDGTCIINRAFSPYCSYLSNTSDSAKCKADCYRNDLCCEECRKISITAMEKGQPNQFNCLGGINIYAVPITYNNQSVGCISIAISVPSISLKKIKSISKKFQVNWEELLSKAKQHKKMSLQTKDIAKMQLDLTALQIGNTYRAKSEGLKSNYFLEKILHEKTDQLKTIINSISEGLIICDEKGKYLIWNSAAYDILDFPEPVNMVGQCSKFSTMKDEEGKVVPAEYYPIKRILSRESVKDLIGIVESRNYKKYLLFNGCPIFDKEGNVEFGLLTFRDITEIKEQLNLVKEQRELIKYALDEIDLPIFILSYPEFKYEFSNKKYTYYLNSLTKGKINKENIETFKFKEVRKLLGKTKVFEFIKNIKKYKNSVKVENIQYDFDGQKKYFTFIFTPLLDNYGEIAQIISVGLETTAQVVSTQRTEEISRLKEEFFANISHEFRTPITIILGAIQMMHNSNDFFEKEQDRRKSSRYLPIIRQNCFRTLRLINNILDINKIDSGYLNLNLQNHDIILVLKDLIQSVSEIAAQKNIKLSFKTSLKKKIMAMDLDIIERIILNLLSNAIKFTSSGEKILVTLVNKGSSVEIKVKDTGIGIPTDMLNKIYERFRQVDNVITRPNEGSGLGLSIVKSLVEMHKGTINVNSKVGKGTEFIINLPNVKIKETSKKFQQIHNVQETINIELSDIYFRDETS